MHLTYLDVIFGDSNLRCVDKVYEDGQSIAVDLLKVDGLCPRLCQPPGEHGVEVLTARGQHQAVGGNLQAVRNQHHITQQVLPETDQSYDKFCLNPTNHTTCSV